MVSAIIVAAGKGVRMKRAVRKQYLALAERPILSLTLQAFEACSEVDRIILVVPGPDLAYCRDTLLVPLKPTCAIELVAGGERRQDSVYNGLRAVAPDPGGIVVIHDGVRPLVQPSQITDCIAGARQFGGCILALSATDTLKDADDSGFIAGTRDRHNIWLAQTPQAFQWDLIKKAHESARREGFTGTDDASLVERMGAKVKIIAGSRLNLKITTPEDLVLAEAILSHTPPA